MQRLLTLVVACSFLIEGCFLDGSGRYVPPDADLSDSMVADTGPEPDADLPDSAVDAGPDADSGSPDASVDDAGPDADVGMMDGGTDSGMPDSGTDAGLDSGPPDSGTDAGPFDSCRDETGNCIRYANPGFRATADWELNVSWNLSGGGISESGYSVVTCIGGLRVEDSSTTECLFTLPARPGTAVGMPTLYLYPRYSDMGSPCNTTTCAHYPTGFSFWEDTFPRTFSLVSDSTPNGTIMVLRIAL